MTKQRTAATIELSPTLGGRVQTVFRFEQRPETLGHLVQPTLPRHFQIIASLGLDGSHFPQCGFPRRCLRQDIDHTNILTVFLPFSKCFCVNGRHQLFVLLYGLRR